MTVLTIYRKITVFGCTVAVAGFLVSLSVYFFTPVYAGASGAGLAGVGSGLAILGGMIALAFGAVLAVSSLLLGRRATSRTRRRP